MNQDTSLTEAAVARAVSLRNTPSTDRIVSALASPWSDRLVAAIACLPFIYSLRHEFRAFGFNPAWIVANANLLLLVVTMLIRRTPSKVTTEPLYWALAFAATYWLLIVGRFITPGLAVAPAWAVTTLSFLSFLISVWARISLGRSIGLVPAHRGLVCKGPYRFVRHPIYTGVFCAYAALALQNFTILNATLLVAGAALFIVKSLVEERFLSHDPGYVAYMALVPWRWIPFAI